MPQMVLEEGPIFLVKLVKKAQLALEGCLIAKLIPEVK